MAQVLAWLNLLLFGGLGLAVSFGVEFAEKRDCVGRCRGNVVADLQDKVGNGPLAVILFFCAIYGFVWYMQKARRA